MKKNSPTANETKETSEPWLVSELKRQTIAITFALVWAFHTFIWNSQTGHVDQKHQLETNTKAIENLKVLIKELSDNDRQQLILMTKSTEAQSWLASEVKTIRDNQTRNAEPLKK